jgi:hypothetical protein
MIKKCSNAYFRLNGKIDTKKDNYIRWTNFNKEKVKEEYFMHHDCWSSFLDTEITKKAQQVMQIGMRQAMSNLAPMIKQLKDGIQ